MNWNAGSLRFSGDLFVPHSDSLQMNTLHNFTAAKNYVVAVI